MGTPGVSFGFNFLDLPKVSATPIPDGPPERSGHCSVPSSGLSFLGLLVTWKLFRVPGSARWAMCALHGDSQEGSVCWETPFLASGGWRPHPLDTHTVSIKWLFLKVEDTNAAADRREPSRGQGQGKP